MLDLREEEKSKLLQDLFQQPLRKEKSLFNASISF